MLAPLAISVGAAIGALFRWRLSVWLNTGGAMPLGTLAANLIGGYFVGVCVAVFQAMPQIDPIWRLALVTGLLGGLTTFSSFSAEVVLMLQAQRYGLALVTAATHLLGSLVLTFAGLKTVAMVLGR
ncbi:fluoride efflux transporter CrcB [Pseudorhodoferax sp.]|uniref:fluoride efflux transporter CrcB n=1 Tax=Pseudorhodoferax sp. TaxID=1993553 RepID=UPI002DD673FE|nr:fluoride efflux transporter CrcB [Pseudorhodoferax sp.]